MKILVALDGSKFAEAVIEPVAQLAARAKAEVFLVQVVEPSRVHSTWVGSPEYYMEAVRGSFNPEGLQVRGVAPQIGAPRAVETADQALKRCKQAAHEYLSRIGHRFAPLKVEPVVLVGDDVDEELASFARERQVDLIAMSSHGRTGLARLVMGSHTGNMLRYRVAPLMIIRPDGLHQAEESAPPAAEEAAIT